MQKYSGCEARSSTTSGIALTKLSDLGEGAICVNTGSYELLLLVKNGPSSVFMEMFVYECMRGLSAITELLSVFP